MPIANAVALTIGIYFTRYDYYRFHFYQFVHLPLLVPIAILPIDAFPCVDFLMVPSLPLIDSPAFPALSFAFAQVPE